MTIELDLDEFYNTDTFGITAAITTDTITLNVNGIFDDNYVDSFDSVGSSLSFECKTVDVVLAAKGNIIQINSVNYRIANKKPDAHGATTILLEAY